MPYRSYFLALLGINVLILMLAAIFLLARSDVFSHILKRVKDNPVERWETERRKFQLYSQTQPPGAILMVGSSHAEQAEWHELLSDARIVNRSISGETVDRTLIRAPELARSRPALVCLMTGTNDLIHYRRPLGRIKVQYDSLIDIFVRSGVPVLVMSTLPTHFDQDMNHRIAQLNRHLLERARNSGGRIRYADLWPALARDGKLVRELSVDGLHLNEKGYAAWARALAPHLPPPETAPIPKATLAE